MLTLRRVLLSFFSPSLCWSALLTQDITDVTLIIQPDSQLSTQPYNTFSPRGLSWCAKECKRRTKCLSFNLVVSTMTCELLDRSSSSNGANVLSANGVLYSEISAWPDDMLDGCNLHACDSTTRCDTDFADNPNCVISECLTDPPSVDKAYLPTSLSREVGHSATYTCNTGYVVEGETPTATCTIDGEWFVNNFICRDCGPPPSVADATPTSSARTVSSIVPYVCDADLTVIDGPAEVVCDAEGEWSTPTFSCGIVLAECGPPPSVASATATGTETTEGSVMPYSCDVGLQVENGPAEALCQSTGSWTTPTFDCVYSTTYNSNSGIIVSPNYPGPYSNDEMLTFTITLEQPGPQTVSFSATINLELRGNTCYDFIRINGGNPACGSGSFSDTITVQGDTWTIYFESDYSVTLSAGFYISYSVV